MKIVQKIAKQIKAKYKHDFDMALILGSGWGEVVTLLENAVTIPYLAIKGMPRCSVKGHEGNFVAGKLYDKHILIMQGRFHLYEGKTVNEVVLPIDIFHQLNIKNLFITNASGGINRKYIPGDLMILHDHINFTGTNPLITNRLEKDKTLFVDMTAVYDEEYIGYLKIICDHYKLTHYDGTYLQVTGPSYETKAEVFAFYQMGADAVGMSTVLEVIKARYYGMRCVAVSLISNIAAGMSNQQLSHEEVLETTTSNKEKLKLVVSEFVKILNNSSSLNDKASNVHRATTVADTKPKEES